MAKTDKTKAKKSSTKAKAGKPGKELTPIQKAQLARAANKGKKGAGKAKSKKKAGVVFKAPEGTKPFFIKTLLSYGKDGIFTEMKVTRVKGNPKNDKAKTVDLALWDPETFAKIGIRFAGAAFVRNEAKRLPANSKAQALFRVAVGREDRAIKVSLKEVKFKAGDSDKKPKALDKKDPIYRAIRKPVKFMAGAFTTLKDFPSAADLKALLKSQED